MRLLGPLTATPLIFSAYVAGDHGYLCSDAGGKTSTAYNQTLVEKSVADVCHPDVELSASELALNLEAKKYPRVWAESEDYGFNETVLLWKYQGNNSESLEELEALVFTNKSCNILGLLQRSGDQYEICKCIVEEHDTEKTSGSMPKKPRPGIFSDYDRMYQSKISDDSRDSQQQRNGNKDGGNNNSAQQKPTEQYIEGHVTGYIHYSRHQLDTVSPSNPRPPIMKDGIFFSSTRNQGS